MRIEHEENRKSSLLASLISLLESFLSLDYRYFNISTGFLSSDQKCSSFTIVCQVPLRCMFHLTDRRSSNIVASMFVFIIVSFFSALDCDSLWTRRWNERFNVHVYHLISFFVLHVSIYWMRPYKRNLTPFSPNWIPGNLQCTSCVYIYAFCFICWIFVFIFIFIFIQAAAMVMAAAPMDLSATDVCVCVCALGNLCVRRSCLSISFSVCMAIGSGFIVFANAYNPI